MPAVPEWKGTQLEMAALTSACNNNCGCEFSDSVLTKACEAHLMLADQKMLDDLLFGRRIAHRLKAEEQMANSDAL